VSSQYGREGGGGHLLARELLPQRRVLLDLSRRAARARVSGAAPRMRGSRAAHGPRGTAAGARRRVRARVGTSSRSEFTSTSVSPPMAASPRRGLLLAMRAVRTPSY
jgi:hypothetical protein